MPSLVEVLRKTEAFLGARGIPQPRREAELLLGHALGLSRMDVYLQFEKPLSEPELIAVRPLVARRGRREPLHWILGTIGFYEHDDFIVRPGVLVPRPDTEALVIEALKLIPEDSDAPFFVADVGAGTGVVGLSIAAARPAVRLFAVDLSDAALANTRENVAMLGLDKRVAVLQGSLLEPIPDNRNIDIVVSNPPYVASATLDTLEPEVRAHEPRLALDGGTDGLAIYRALIPAAAQRARVGVLVEIGHDQGQAVAELFTQAGLTDVTVHQDLGRRDRVVSGRRASPAT